MALGFRSSATAAAVLTCILCSLVSSLAEQAPNYTFVKHAVHAPPVSYYDYIVIGGGTAGCPLAATLSQHSNVLLLERGGSPYGNQNISNLYTFADTLADNSPNSPAQRFISEDGVLNSRARVLGGGSCLNAGFYTRAAHDYVRQVGWDSRLVGESYTWVERTVAFKPPVKEWQSAVRDGLLEVGITPDNGFTYEHLFGTKIGGTIFDKAGHRHTAADLLENANPMGLTVLLHATVAKILFIRKEGQHPKAHGVVFWDAAGIRHKAYLKRGSPNEIILSAGAIASPQLLMLSGIGPRKHLESFGIRVVVDQPMVGQGMSDNPMNAIFIPSPLPVEVSLIQVVGITRYGTYIEAASGAFFASNPASTAAKKWDMFITQTGQESTAPPPNMRGGFILEKILGPLSTGHLELKTRNPNDNPSVTFNYFKEHQDLKRCIAGIKTIESIINSKAFSKFRYPFISMEALINMTAEFPVNNIPRHDNDSTSLEQYCKDTVMTIWHYHGGCQVGRVVDDDYKVYGIDGLRVVDGSTFNSSPGTNPQATVMMLGRYMGVKILSERLRMMREDTKVG